MKKFSLLFLTIIVAFFYVNNGFAQQGLHSATDSVMPPSTNTVTDWGRGFRFEPTQDLYVIKLGKYVPGNGTYVWVIWDVVTQTKVYEQNSQVNSPNQYVYEDVDSIIMLQSGRQYILELYGIGSAMYYYGTSSQIGQHLIYYDMMYCGSCGPNTYPTSVLANIHYGVPDFLYALDPPSHPNDAGVDSLMSPRVDGEFCSGKQEIVIRMQNFGTNAIDSLKLHWSLNGVRQPDRSFIFNPPFDSIKGPNHDTIISLGFYHFDFEQPMHIKAWTSMPNGVIDTSNANDTLYRVITSKKLGVTADITPRDVSICQGSSAILDAGNQAAGSIFIWNTGAITQKTLVTKSGYYDVVIQSATGCLDWDTVKVELLEKPIAGDFGSIDKGNNLFEFTPTRMQNIDYYHWDFGDSASIFAATDAVQQHRYKKPGAYIVSLTIANQCDTFVLNKQIFVHPEEGTGLPTNIQDLKDKIKVFPNPANHYLNILKSDESINIQGITLYNMLGKKILSEGMADNYRLNVAHLPTGIYQVIIYTDKGAVKQKIELRK